MRLHASTIRCTARWATLRRRNWLKSRIRRSGGLPGASVESWTAMSRGFQAASSCGSAMDGPAARFGMPPEPEDYGRSARHTREQVNSFRASAQQLLDYHDMTYERMKTYLNSLSADELARELDELQYDPRPTVAVRLVSVLENAMTNEGQISYLKAYHRLGGWFPREAKDPASVR